MLGKKIKKKKRAFVLIALLNYLDLVLGLSAQVEVFLFFIFSSLMGKKTREKEPQILLIFIILFHDI